MPAVKVTNQATNADSLSNLQFVKLLASAFISLYASTVTNSDVISLFADSNVIVATAVPNIEASADVVDIDRDAITIREPILGGRALRQPITVTTAMNFLLMIEYAGMFL